ncbi:hypothetical protein CBA19CS11_37590 [Caballeronia novacaledonica]|jgi:hypothetical protein|uniref:DUF4148 domain-containing protein n=1 Tax=Caballeronia novacaledonica TaxID=1544861 RepID=A0AA37IJD4_9BURK|nr:hypothetical protein [Caballeronia novacaledonica]GJH14678.1 hypothetical protein CBA19CS11_37590 [Caballeronia novacaledonica]GJH30861.1 hypothetical protein CBA19CS42_40115 [Caballeronia novacaledonica]
MIKQFVTAAVIAVSAVAAGSAFASSGYGPAPHYDPLAGAPASQRGVSVQTIASESAAMPMQAYGGMTDTISQSGARGTSANDVARLFAHH